MTDIFTQITSNFHFLRSAWLWMFVPWLLLAVFILRKTKDEDDWRKGIPEHIANYLIVKGRENSKLPRVLMLIVFALLIVSAAGPTWEKIEKPGVKSKASLVIALDLSRSMLVKDIEPNRLERAKAKVSDLLELNPAAPTALVGYAGTAHSVLYFTSDYKTINYLLEYVSPGVMPVKGSSLKSAIILSDSLLETTGIPGTILIITDDIKLSDIDVISNYLNSSRHRIEFYFISTSSGGPIPLSKNKYIRDGGSTVISKLNIDGISQLQKIEGVNVNLITLDESDVEQIASNIKRNLNFEEKEKDDNEEWQDYGYWFMLPALFLMLFWFRKGWVVNWVFLIAVLPWYACTNQNEQNINSTEFRFADLWFTKDYQAQQLYNTGKYEEAAALFEDEFMKGVAYYKAGSFEHAAQVFYPLRTPQSYFNLGMCMAEMGNWGEGVFAFEEALKLYPDYTEAIRNLELVKNLIPKKKKIELVTPQSFEDKFMGKSEELDQESEKEGDKEEQVGGDKSTEEQVGASMAPQNQDFSLPGENDKQQNENQKDILLKQMSDNPSIFLKRKFRMQYEKMKNKVEIPMDKW